YIPQILKFYRYAKSCAWEQITLRNLEQLIYRWVYYLMNNTDLTPDQLLCAAVETELSPRILEHPILWPQDLKYTQVRLSNYQPFQDDLKSAPLWLSSSRREILYRLDAHLAFRKQYPNQASLAVLLEGPSGKGKSLMCTYALEKQSFQRITLEQLKHWKP